MTPDKAGIADLARPAPDVPVLIAGPTASGKSALALRIATAQARTVVNADALQVFDGWAVLTARPGPGDLARAPHRLYGHVPHDAPYTVGDWLRAVAPHLTASPAPVIVGGTGLYFRALTEGLADIPATRPEVRQAAEAQLARRGLDAMAAELDGDTRAGLDLANPRRVLRAWEVQTQTGRGIAAWQAETGPPLLPADRALRLLLGADRDWLADRIDRRFDAMMAAGALEEARAMAADWDPRRQSSRAIGAAPLIAVVRGEMPLGDAVAQAKLASRQYAKRQRTWFRARMADWRQIDARTL